MNKDIVREYMRELGKLGKGEAKRRGDSEYYKKIRKIGEKKSKMRAKLLLDSGAAKVIK